MKSISTLHLTAATFATTVLLHAQVESPTPSATPSPAAAAPALVYEPMPTLKASVILQPQYLQGPNLRSPKRVAPRPPFGILSRPTPARTATRLTPITGFLKLTATRC